MFALDRCVSVQMHFGQCQNELLVGIFDFSRYMFHYCWFISMLPSIVHAGPSGGLLSENINISKVLYAFLKGQVEAMLA